MAGAGIVRTAGVLCGLRRRVLAMQAVQWCCVGCTGRRFDCKHSWQQVCCGLAVHTSACHMASVPADSLRSQLSLLRRYCAGLAGSGRAKAEQLLVPGGRQLDSGHCKVVRLLCRDFCSAVSQPVRCLTGS
eukprot:GHRQ01027030.1.p1 GENE.GHRQ01027030.1~~GHRQ01027030.1.p1  ORF type:complete len:131 (+),score=28.17 GHRQ01027030.1:631-1023(+)